MLVKLVCVREPEIEEDREFEEVLINSDKIVAVDQRNIDGFSYCHVQLVEGHFINIAYSLDTLHDLCNGI